MRIAAHRGVTVDTPVERPHAWHVSDPELQELMASLAEAQRSTQRELDELGRYVKPLEGVHAVHFGRLVEAIVAPAWATGFMVSEPVRKAQAASPKPVVCPRA